MSRSDNRAALTDEVARFQAEVQSLAFAIARAVVQQELERKRQDAARKKPDAGRKKADGRRKPSESGRKPSEGGRKPSDAERKQQELDFEQVKRPRGRPRKAKLDETALAPPREAPGAPAPAAPSEPVVVPAAEAPPASRKRVPWTRESIVNELANWMLSGTAIDATFVTRHGPPGLVAATRRVFGRFDAALNVAALHVSKLYPDGPPER